MAEPRIVWQVENPFRFFLDPPTPRCIGRPGPACRPSSAPTPVLSAERVLAERHPDGWSATMFDKTCWDGDRNRYACRERGRLHQPQEPHHSRQPARSRRRADRRLHLADRAAAASGGRGKAVTLPCDTPVQLEVPYPGGAWIRVEIGGQQVAEVAGRGAPTSSSSAWATASPPAKAIPDVPVRFSPERTAEYGVDANNVPLDGYPARVGDWKTIGEKKFIEENARWLDQACHRSLYSHQLRAALQLAVEDPHRAVTFVGVACSGAETVFGLFLRYKGHEWVPNPPALSQISAVAEAQCGGQRGARRTICPRPIT